MTAHESEVDSSRARALTNPRSSALSVFWSWAETESSAMAFSDFQSLAMELIQMYDTQNIYFVKPLQFLLYYKK